MSVALEIERTIERTVAAGVRRGPEIERKVAAFSFVERQIAVTVAFSACSDTVAESVAFSFLGKNDCRISCVFRWF